MLLTAPLLAALGACGQGVGGSRTELIETNSGSIVMNDAQANQALESSNEQPPNLVAPAGGSGGAANP
jgi:hypothetical protein